VSLTINILPTLIVRASTVELASEKALLDEPCPSLRPTCGPRTLAASLTPVCEGTMQMHCARILTTSRSIRPAVAFGCLLGECWPDERRAADNLPVQRAPRLGPSAPRTGSAGQFR